MARKLVVVSIRRTEQKIGSTKELLMIKVSRNLSAIMIGIGALSPIMFAGAQTRAGETLFAMSNNADKNEVLKFVLSPDGSTSVAQNSYDTHGRGSGGTNDPLEAQGSLTLSDDHSLLFAANAGSGDVTVFRVERGGLNFVDKEPSGGSGPVAVAQSQNRLYVLNQGGAGSVVGFQVGNDGHLRPIADSTSFLSATAVGGSSISISPDGQTLAVVQRLANNIDIFNINPNGTLAPIVINPSPAPGAFSGRFAPDGKLIVSETGPAGAVGASAISSYSVLPGGALSAVSHSVPTFGDANCWNAISPDGTHVYVSNAGSSNLSGFTIGAGGGLSAIGSTILASNPAGSTNLDITTSGDGKFLYSLNAQVGTIGVFSIRPDGSLSEVAEISGFPKAVGFNGIAAL
jgi:6-phosphogluconolactonase (cycloisomerase 2 family)